MPKGIYIRKPFSLETRNKMRLNRLGKVGYMKGKHQSEEAKEKISKALKGRILPKGKKMSEETKKKMSDMRKGIMPKNINLLIQKAIKFKKGDIPWIKGKHHTTETNEKNSLAHKGKMMGENNPRYTGYINKKYKIRMIDWLLLRQIVLERDNFTCQDCGKTHHEVKLDVHHKIPFRVSQDNSLNNLITLCRSCHMRTEAILIKSWRNSLSLI